MTGADRFADLDAVDTARLVATGAASAVEVVGAALARIAARDRAVNAYTVVTADAALAAAAAVDARRAAGERLGPLAGVPVSVKDHVWVAGLPATNGSRALEQFTPARTCVAVQRLVDAGAVVVGKTNNPEFCYRGYTDNALYGLTRNPRHLGRTPGGSSGGAGASVASGTVPLAVGTDGGGSIRIPAAFCGIVGLKPTFGRIPTRPGFRGWPTLSVHGPLARSVRDLALATAVMGGPTADDPSTQPGPPVPASLDAPADLAGRRVAVSADLGFAALDDDVRAAFDALVARLPGLGADVAPAHPATGDPLPTWDVTALAEGWASEGPLLADHADRLWPGTAEIVRAGAEISAGRYLDVQAGRAAWTGAWERFFADHDVLLAPALPVTAFPVGRDGPATVGGVTQPPSFDAWCALALPANLTGQPAACVPMGTGRDGLPVAVQVIGPRWADARVLQVATVLAAAVGVPPPGVTVGA